MLTRLRPDHHKGALDVTQAHGSELNRFPIAPRMDVDWRSTGYYQILVNFFPFFLPTKLTRTTNTTSAQDVDGWRQRWSIPLILREWESGNGSFSFLRTLRELEWEWEWVWVIRKNFAREPKFFFWNRYRVGEVFWVKKSRFFWCSGLSKMSIFFLRK